MAASKKQEILDGTRRYLREDHARDPAANPAEIKAIATHLGLARGTFYNWLRKDDPEIRALVQEIEDADEASARRGAKAVFALDPEDAGAAAGASTRELERELREGIERVVWAMRGFVSLVEQSSGVAESPLHLAELDAKLTQCRAIYRDLQAPYTEWLARRAAGMPVSGEPEAGDPDVADQQAYLNLDLPDLDGETEGPNDG
jgi:hypothetical protein